MLNEFAYCPRLAYLEWVQGDFADSADTVEGRFHHRRVDKETGELPAAEAAVPAEPPEKLHARSVYLSGPVVGLVARIDLVEAVGTHVTPVDYKRGEAPDLPEGAWEPERVQVCAQGLILEENGYRCSEGVLYFVGSRKRVTIPFTDALRGRTRELLAAMRKTLGEGVIPPPLQDSPKCPRCSLVGICLPDEINLLRLDGRGQPAADTDDDGTGTEPRRLLPARDDALPLYVQSAGARVGKSGDELTVQPREGARQTARLVQTSHVALFGQVQMSTQAIQTVVGRGIPITYFTSGGWFYGMTTGLAHKNIELRRLQFRTAEDDVASLDLAKQFIATKILNCRTLLRRNADDVAPLTIERLKALASDAGECESAASLLGIEGTAARLYYQSFAKMLKRSEQPGIGGMVFDFDGRNRRPPRDPINALLSFAYALLAKDLTVMVQAVGFDPFLGFYHRPRYGRPALALDLMEEFRPIVADSIVLSAVNTGIVQEGDFVGRAGAVALGPPGRARFLRLYERRMDELVTHPIFGYRICYRRVLEVQARLLARHLAREIPRYPGFLTR